MSNVTKLFLIAMSVQTILGASAPLAVENEAQKAATDDGSAVVMFLAGETELGTVTIQSGDTEQGAAAFPLGDYKSINNTVDGEFGP